MGKTVGLLGYRTIIDLIIGVIKMVLMIAGIALVAASATVYGAVAAGPTAIGWVLIILTFVWDLFIGGNAVAVANDTSLGAGIASYFIAALIIMVIMVTIIAAVLVGAGMTGISGLSMWGA